MPTKRKPRLTDEENFKPKEAGLPAPEEENEPFWREEDKSISNYNVNTDGTVTYRHERTPNMIDPTDFEGGKELGPVPPDIEVKFRVVGCTKAIDRNGDNYYRVNMEAVEYPDTKDFSHMLYENSSNPNMREKIRQMRKFEWTQFMECTGFRPDHAFDPTNEFLDLEGWAVLSIQDSDEWGKQNRVKKWIRP